MRIIGDGGHAKVVRAIAGHTMAFPAFLVDGYLVAVGDNATRKQQVEKLGNVVFCWAVHNKAILEQSTIGVGSVICAGAVVGVDVVIGKHCIINHGATVDHDCILGDYVHIAPGAHLCGGVKVGEGALVGVGVGIAPGAIIPPWCIVKAARLDIEMVAP